MRNRHSRSRSRSQVRFVTHTDADGRPDLKRIIYPEQGSTAIAGSLEVWETESLGRDKKYKNDDYFEEGRHHRRASRRGEVNRGREASHESRGRTRRRRSWREKLLHWGLLTLMCAVPIYHRHRESSCSRNSRSGGRSRSPRRDSSLPEVAPSIEFALHPLSTPPLESTEVIPGGSTLQLGDSQIRIIEWFNGLVGFDVRIGCETTADRSCNPKGVWFPSLIQCNGSGIPYQKTARD